MWRRKMTDPLQTMIGVKASVFIASIMGGAVGAVLIGGSLLKQVVNTFVGAIAAIYWGPILVKAVRSRINVDIDVEHALIFLAGLMGMIVCEFVIRVAQRLRSRANDVADKAIEKVMK
jgi:uncharacterized membrane protein